MLLAHTQKRTTKKKSRKKNMAIFVEIVSSRISQSVFYVQYNKDDRSVIKFQTAQDYIYTHMSRYTKTENRAARFYIHICKRSLYWPISLVNPWQRRSITEGMYIQIAQVKPIKRTRYSLALFEWQFLLQGYIEAPQRPTRNRCQYRKLVPFISWPREKIPTGD